MANWDRDHLSSLGINVKLPLKRGFGRTERIDYWWTEPVWMAVPLRTDLHSSQSCKWDELYIMMITGNVPIFSPDVLHMLHITNHPGWMNSAMLILWIPFGFRGLAIT